MSEIYQIISITVCRINDTDTQSVNARELHGFLESKQEFSHWIKNRIEDYDFTQSIDFIVIDNFIIDATAFGGKRKVIDYHITLDMAKELSMVERNAKGKEARKYFIACERKLKEQQTPQPRQLEYTPAQRAQVDFDALMSIAERAEVPKSFALQECAKMATRASGCDITPLITQAAGMDKVPNKDVMLEPTELGKHYGLSGKAMNNKLMDLDLQYRDKEGWKPTEKGEPLCEKHAWAVKNKSGYNLKWNWQGVDDFLSDGCLNAL